MSELFLADGEPVASQRNRFRRDRTETIHHDDPLKLRKQSLNQLLQAGHADEH